MRGIVTEENGVLLKPARSVKLFDHGLRSLVDEMLSIMYAAHGVGLAAPQIGIRLRVAVIDVDPESGPDSHIVLVNPRIISSDGTQLADEGCLSIPGYRFPIARAKTVTVGAYSEYGKSFTFTGHDLMARALQHECDHLDGLLIRRLTNGKQEIVG